MKSERIGKDQVPLVFGPDQIVDLQAAKIDTRFQGVAAHDVGGDVLILKRILHAALRKAARAADGEEIGDVGGGLLADRSHGMMNPFE